MFYVRLKKVLADYQQNTKIVRISSFFVILKTQKA